MVSEKNGPAMQTPTQILQRLTEMNIRLDEVEERFVRGTGPGGQKINKTSSTVWLRHRPTGIEVRCQAGRSQTANRELAWRELCDRLVARQLAAKAEQRDEYEVQRRRARQKSHTQKAKMVDAKKRHARTKATRGRVDRFE